MIMLNPNKGRVTTIVANIKQKRGQGQPQSHEASHEEERQEPESDAMAAKMAAMDSLFIAVEKRDAKAAVRAMQTFLEVCQYGDEDGEKEEEDDDKHDQPAYSAPQYGSKR